MESPTDHITGGIITSALGSWSSRVLSAEQDPTGMGRWSKLLFTGKKQRYHYSLGTIVFAVKVMIVHGQTMKQSSS
jgi:hypothetical protein